jgi:hypothetical protein
MGLYDPSSNVLGFVTSGLERMRIANTGNVGIGFNNPQYLLDISGGAAGFRGEVHINTSASNAGMKIFNPAGSTSYFQFGSNTNAIAETAGRNLSFGPVFSTAPWMFIQSNGSVGVSTAAPRSGWITNNQNGGPAFDVSGQMYGRLPVIVWASANGNSIDYNTNFPTYQNSYVYITNSAFNAITLPSSTATSNGGAFLQLKNSTSSFLSITLTNTLTLTSPVSIAPSNAITFVVSPSNANTMLLF